MHISQLYHYFIKSCRGTPCQSLEIDPSGPLHDRAWMIVEAETGDMITQRRDPRLALVTAELVAGVLIISAKGSGRTGVPRSLWESGRPIATKVHKQPCEGLDQGDEVARWFSSFLGRPVRLLRMSDSHRRIPQRLPDGVEATFKFSDGYPFLLTSLTSLEELNRERPLPLRTPMARFRPNIVVAEVVNPWNEETWCRFQIGPVVFHAMKPCDRCVIITTDQKTGERPDSTKLLTELIRVHASDDGKPLFGMNLVHEGTGTINIRDNIQNITFGARPPL